MLIAHSQLPRYGNNPSVHQEMMVEEIVTHTDTQWSAAQTHSGVLLSHKGQHLTHADAQESAAQS